MRVLLTALIMSAMMTSSPVPRVFGADSDGKGPGTCLIIDNRSSDNERVTVQVPSVYDNLYWDIRSGSRYYLKDSHGNAIVSTAETNPSGGNWDIQISTGGKHSDWYYDPSRLRSIGCEGTWVVTVTDIDRSIA